MTDIVAIERTVSGGAVDQQRDVDKIWAALVQIGAERGGVITTPLSSPDKQLLRQYLISAIRSFQTFQTLPVTGRIDPGDATIRRINALLNPGAPQPTPQRNTRSGQLKPLTGRDGLADFVRINTTAPNQRSLNEDWTFTWEQRFGSGTVRYFELDEDTVPNWFGVVIPDGLTTFEHVHLFFHPTSGPRQGGFLDENYPSKKGWAGLFHYLTQPLAAQFCAAKSGQVLIMPLMTLSVTQTAGILPARWETLFGQMLGRIANGNLTQQTEPARISSLVVSSFSSGIIYSAAFRSRTKLGSKLRAVVDFDGIISSNRHYSQILGPTAWKFYQSDASPGALKQLTAQRIIPLPPSRWAPEWKLPTAPVPRMYRIHGLIPQSLMFTAASLTRAS
jgi:hypothetical protein